LIGWHACAFFLSHPYKFLSYVLLALSAGLLAVLDNIGIYVDNPWKARQTRHAAYLTLGAMALFYVLMRTLWVL
jgi:F0F1-type ATP synthase assembly protein I